MRHTARMGLGFFLSRSFQCPVAMPAGDEIPVRCGGRRSSGKGQSGTSPLPQDQAQVMDSGPGGVALGVAGGGHPAAATPGEPACAGDGFLDEDLAVTEGSSEGGEAVAGVVTGGLTADATCVLLCQVGSGRLQLERVALCSSARAG